MLLANISKMEDRKNIVGIVLAGGTGTRLRPNTLVTNKHLLPVYNQPMIYYPLEVMRRAGIKEVIIVTGAESAGDFMELLGTGENWGLDLTYKIQAKADGIAGAIKLCKSIVAGRTCAVILGDNIYDDTNVLHRGLDTYTGGGKVFLKEVKDPGRFGVASLENHGGNEVIAHIVEKPKTDVGNMAVTGLYIYDNTLWSYIDRLVPSARGEYEITDVNNMYTVGWRLSFDKVPGFWSDAGTYDSLLLSANHVATIKELDSR